MATFGEIPNFIALMGELLIKKYDAEWIMELSSDNITYNPYLKIRDKKVQFFIYLFEDIFIKEKPVANLLTEIYRTVDEIEISGLC